MLKQGLSYLNNSATANIGNSQLSKPIGGEFITARVTDISLNSNSQIFDETGGWGGIGSIKFQQLDKTVSPNNKNQENTTFAKPINGQFKTFPLVNEVVLIFRGPSTQKTQSSNTKTYYYINTVALWNNQHVNPFPDVFFDNTSVTPSMNKSNSDLQAGSVAKTSKKTTQLSLNGNSGGTFVEKGNVHPILPYAGDNIFEGRFGNSIRLGNTSKTGGLRNNWSESGDSGEPITILKNGQPSSGSSKGFEPIVEDINTDPTSIYLTSTQKIPIQISTSTQGVGEAATVPFSNLVEVTPKSPTSYNAPQVILNSSRLLFNSTTDSILFSSQKSIVAEAREDVGVKSLGGNLTLTADKGTVSLGVKDADQSLVRGNDFASNYWVLLNAMENLLSSLKNEASIPGAASAAALLLTQLNEINVSDSSKFKFLSNKVKTI